MATCFECDDVIHGKITLPHYVKAVIYTKEFQRLRNVKQLGVQNYVFSGANHTR
jgi:HD superfamily phosphohydrolase